MRFSLVSLLFGVYLGLWGSVLSYIPRNIRFFAVPVNGLRVERMDLSFGVILHQ
jgi:hypothetical protein